jgi:hypothetical protein
MHLYHYYNGKHVENQGLEAEKRMNAAGWVVIGICVFWMIVGLIRNRGL